MNKGVTGVIFFAVGGTLGFLTANKILKDKYDQLVQDEVNSVKAAFRQIRPLPKKEKARKDRAAYAKYVKDLGYTPEAKVEPEPKPRIISPDEFGDKDDYDQISLTCYADGTVTDDNDHIMNELEIAETIGKESLTHFGEYEEDSVFVRNDLLKADYEILRDQGTYADMLTENPHLTMR